MALTPLYIPQSSLLWLYCQKITPQPCNLLQGRVVGRHTAMSWFKLFVLYFIWWEFPCGIFNIELDPCCLDHGQCTIWLNSTWSNSTSVLSLSLVSMRGIQAMLLSAFPILPVSFALTHVSFLRLMTFSFFQYQQIPLRLLLLLLLHSDHSFYSLLSSSSLPPSPF